MSRHLLRRSALSAAALLFLSSAALPVAAQSRQEGRESRRAGSSTLPPVGKGVQKVEKLSPANRAEKRSAASQQTVAGKVLSTDPSKGTAQVQTKRGVVTVRARPSDAAQMQPGEETFLNVQKSGSELWLEPTAPSGFGTADVTQQPGMGAATSSLDSEAYSQTGRAGGTVTDVDVKAGTFTVDGQTFTAHPGQLRSLKAGQQVSVDYGVAGENGWADRIYVGADAPLPPEPKAKAPPAPAPQDDADDEEKEDKD